MTLFKDLIRTMAAHPTAANLLMFFFVLIGLITVGDLRRETFPDFSSSQVEISAVYPGASAIDVESSVCNRIEDAIEDVANVAEIKSEARENQARVVVEMRDGADATEFLNDIKTEVEAIGDFPDEAEDVVVKFLNRSDQVLSVAVTGPMSVQHLKYYCESLKDRLKQRELISQVNVLGFSTHQLRVEIPFHNLMRLGLSVTDIAHLIGAQSVDMPSGSLETDDADILIRFSEERRTVRELEELVVVAGKYGAEVRLGNIAKITDRFEKDEEKILFNGKRAGMLQINKTKSEDALDILDDVNLFLDRERKMAPPGVAFTVTQNMSEVVRDRLNLLVINGAEGLLLVFFTMWLFFSFRFSFWVAMGLPVSFLGTIFIMKQIGFSLNMLSMVGLLIAIGLLMDDAIVIAENIASQMGKGKKPLDAAVDGVSEVSIGVFSSFLTTLFIFGSLAVCMEGDIGKVLYAIPVVLILTLSVSVVEAFLILPNHLSHSLSAMAEDKKGRFQQGVDRALEWAREKILGRAVDLAVDWRYLFVGLVIFVFFVSVAMIAGGRLKIVAFPEMDGDVVQARILLPQGTPLHRTEAVVDRVVEALKKVDDEFTPLQPGGKRLIQNYSVLYNTNADANETGAHVATVSVDLLESETRNATIDALTDRWRHHAGDVPDVINIAYKDLSIGPGGLPIEIRLQGDDLGRLKAASNRLMDWLNAYDGVRDLDDDLRPGKPEILVKLKEGAKARGFDASTIAGQLRSAFQGVTVGEVQFGDESYDVDVRISEADANTVADLELFRIIGNQGEKTPIRSVAGLTESRGYSRIARIDSLRTVTITGDLDTEKANANEIIADTKRNFLPKLKETFPDITVSTEGQSAETQKSMGSMITAFLIGIFGVYALLSVQFKSWLEPVIIMITIPFALIGVIWGHLVMGLDLSMPSIMGFISLAGIVVNDSILLVSFIKDHLASGETPEDASKKASRLRFRAVLLTSVTTIMGLVPLLSERSMQAQTLIPLACSIVFGLLASTVLVLIVIPSLYAISGDFTPSTQTAKR